MAPRIGLGPLTYFMAAASVALDRAGSFVADGLPLGFGVDVGRLAAELAHFGSFLAAAAAFGSLILQVLDRLAAWRHARAARTNPTTQPHPCRRADRPCSRS